MKNKTKHQKKSTASEVSYQPHEHSRFFHSNENGAAVAEEFHDEVPIEDFKSNWSQDQDRSEDLAEGRDAIQQPQDEIQIPQEYIKERAYQLYEQPGRISNGDVSDWFEAEHQLRQEIGPR